MSFAVEHANYSCGCNLGKLQAIVLAHPSRANDNQRMDTPPPSPAPWTFADSMYGIGNCLIDRDGRVIGAHLPIGNGPLIAQAPAMAALLRELVARDGPEQLRSRSSAILREIGRRVPREPGEDDE